MVDIFYQYHLTCNSSSLPPRTVRIIDSPTPRFPEPELFASKLAGLGPTISASTSQEKPHSSWLIASFNLHIRLHIKITIMPIFERIISLFFSSSALVGQEALWLLRTERSESERNPNNQRPVWVGRAWKPETRCTVHFYTCPESPSNLLRWRTPLYRNGIHPGGYPPSYIG